jgi:hypothetical protein
MRQTDNQQPKVSDLEYGWLCGFWDGEGTFCLSMRAKAGKGNGPKITPHCSVTSTEVDNLNKATKILEDAGIGHHVAWYTPKGFTNNGKTYKPAWTITIVGHNRCGKFVPWIEPGLCGKKERADNLMDYMRLRSRHTDFRTPIQPDELELALKQRVLNLKGKAQPYVTEITLNTTKPGASHEKLSENGMKGAVARWGNK